MAVKMSEARCLDRDYPQIVVADDSTLAGRWRSMRLSCLFCDVAVHHRHTTRIVGNRPLFAPHFSRKRDTPHEPDCEGPRGSNEPSGRRFDPSLGYRLHIEGDRYDLRTGPYGFDKNGRMRLKDRRLARMESKTIATADDVRRLIAYGDPDRLRQSVVMRPNAATPLRFQEFLIRYKRNGGNEDRFVDLMDRVRSKEFQHAACQIVTEGRVTRQGEDLALSRTVHGMLEGRPVAISPRVHFNIVSMGSETLMRDPGEYLVLAQPRFVFAGAYGGRDVYAMNIHVTAADQVVSASLPGLVEKGRRNAARRHAPRLAAE